ncbi:MAG: V-type ATP synthase subunit F, partial [Gammaproteobacteria bacterium]
MRKTLHSPSKQPREIAVLAERGLVDALRLAGVGRCRVLPADEKVRDEIDATLREWLGNEAIGVIVIGEAHAALAGEQLGAVRASKR